MPARVGVLRCRYRVRGAVDPADLDRLDRLAARRVPAELEPALGEFGADAAVYVVRRVRAATTLDPTSTPDPGLARSWGSDLARSVTRTITADPGDGTNLIRFDSRAEYVVAFVADLLDGTAWQRWYFGAFARHRHRDGASAIAEVLRDHRDELAAVLAVLVRRGLLERVLATVDPAELGLGPTRAQPATSTGTAEGWRPLVAAALDLARSLRMRDDGAAPDPAELLRRWVDTGHPEPDWRDPGALADAVAAVVGWLVRTGVARGPDPDVIVAAAAPDWLDGPRLVAAVAAIGPPEPGAAPLPGRVPTATPRQRDLLAALLHAVRERRPVLDGSPAARPADAVRLLAALGAVDPGRAADPLAPVLIDRLLAARVALAAAPSRVLAALIAGDPAAAVAGWRGPVQRSAGDRPDDRHAPGGRARPTPVGSGAGTAAAAEAVTAVAALGAPAGRVLAELAGPAQPAGGDAVSSPVAGILLLLRAVLDVRLAGLAGRHGYPPAGPEYLLAAVGLRWAGAGGESAGRLDPAVRLLAGGGPETTAELSAAWRSVGAAAHARWREALDELVRGHRATEVAAAADPLQHTADAVLRIWARWLRGFESSSTDYLLSQLVRRPGTVLRHPDRLVVRLPRAPLDTLLELSGYLRSIERLVGPGPRRVEFVVGEC